MDDDYERDDSFRKPKGGGVNKSKTPTLDNFGKDLTKMAKDGLIDPIIGRDDEIERVSQILSRRKKNNPILIGEPGVGKTAVVEGLALKIIQKKCPRILQGSRVVALELTSMVAGTKYRGQFEERMKALLDELEKVNDVIIFIDEIHTMVGAGNASGSMDASNILKPALARGTIQCIGATTLDEYREHIEKDGALVRRFQNVTVDPPNTEEALNILHNIKSMYEKHHKVRYTDGAIDACVKLANRYITDRENPDKAIDIMDEAGAKAQVNEKPSKEILDLEKQVAKISKQKEDVIKAQKYEDAADLRDKERAIQLKLEDAIERWNNDMANNYTEVTGDDIATIVSKMTGIPVNKVDVNQIEKLNSIDKELKSSVIGQDIAIDQIVAAVKRSRVGVNRPNKPIGSFMFIGSTGVGKTHLAKQLAKSVFGSEDNLIRLDMSEYGEKHSGSRLMGAPPGYVGYEEGGQLTEQVRRKPYSVVLFDEIEKAHPDIFNTLLQVLDEGRLTDGMGRTVNFRNTIIIMTSNVGSRKLQDFGTGVGFDTSAKRETRDTLANDIIYTSLKKKFAPEFLNRIDDIILFRSLTKDDIKKMINIPVSETIERIKDLGYGLTVSPKLIDYLCEVGWDPEMGARPLNRAIQKYIEDPISQYILDGKAKEGDHLKIGISKDEPVVTSK